MCLFCAAFSLATLSTPSFSPIPPPPPPIILSSCTFEGADLTDAIFEDALIGGEDAKRLCLNPTLTGASRAGVGCRGK